MSQKKPTTNQQLEEMRAMIANLEPGKVVTLDRELQERNTTLMLMLYGAVAKYGVGVNNASNGVLVTAQVPVLQVPANHSLQWEVSEDGKSVMLYIVLNETVKADGDTAEGESALEAKVSVSPTSPSPDPTPLTSTLDVHVAVGPEAVTEAVNAIGDEFEDEIKVGLSDAEEEYREGEMNHGD